MKRFLLVSGAVALVLLLLVSAWIDANNAGVGGAIDLRNRITGGRLLSDGTDPYTYKWDMSESGLYCDPFNNPHLPVSKTTSSPAMLGFTLPWAALPYRSGQMLWLVAQWALLLGTGWLWWGLCRTNGQRLLLASLLTAFTYSAAWRLGAERGQSYTVLAFFLALWLAGSLRTGKGWSFFAGFAAGFLVMLRPPCLLLLPVLAIRRRDQWLGISSGLLVGLLLPMMFMGGIWGDYASAMQENSFLYRNGLNPRPGLQHFPDLVEDIPLVTISRYVPISYADSSIHRLLREMGTESASGGLVLFAGVIPFGLWCWWAWKRRLDLPRLLLGVAAWAYLLDFFLPAYRNIYNDVLALNFLFIATLVAPRFWPAVITVTAAFVFGISVYANSPETTLYIDTPSILFALGAVLWLFAPASGSGLALDTTAAPRQNRKC